MQFVLNSFCQRPLINVYFEYVISLFHVPDPLKRNLSLFGTCILTFSRKTSVFPQSMQNTCKFQLDIPLEFNYSSFFGECNYSSLYSSIIPHFFEE